MMRSRFVSFCVLPACTLQRRSVGRTGGADGVLRQSVSWHRSLYVHKHGGPNGSARAAHKSGADGAFNAGAKGGRHSEVLGGLDSSANAACAESRMYEPAPEPAGAVGSAP